MKAKDKAEELIEVFRDDNYFSEAEIRENAVANSLIVVGEMLKESAPFSYLDVKRGIFWCEVEVELIKMLESKL